MDEEKEKEVKQLFHHFAIIASKIHSRDMYTHTQSSIGKKWFKLLSNNTDNFGHKNLMMYSSSVCLWSTSTFERMNWAAQVFLVMKTFNVDVLFDCAELLSSSCIF